MSSFVNFAYGSNMCVARLRERTPSARPLGIAQLRGYRLGWHKLGRDGSAKCDIVRSDDALDSVWGVLYEIATVERARLDAAEGLGRDYDAVELDVAAGPRTVRALAYVATRIEAGLRPFDWYHAFVLHGARAHGLPADYLRALRAVETAVDADAARRALNFALIDGDGPAKGSSP